MIDRIRQFFRDMAGGTATLDVGEEEIRLAVGAILFHLIAVDGLVSEAECAALRAILTDRFDLAPGETAALIAAAESADAEAVDLYGFTSVLKRRLPEADRERIIEMMWRLTYADGGVHEFEDNVVWRVAELLAVPPEVRIRLKHAVRHDVR